MSAAIFFKISRCGQKRKGEGKGEARKDDSGFMRQVRQCLSLKGRKCLSGTALMARISRARSPITAAEPPRTALVSKTLRTHCPEFAPAEQQSPQCLFPSSSCVFPVTKLLGESISSTCAQTTRTFARTFAAANCSVLEETQPQLTSEHKACT